MDQLIFTKVKKEFSLNTQNKILQLNSLSSNSPPSIFVGSKLPYPLVNVGILAPPEKLEHSWYLDSPNAWASEGLTIQDILNLRSQLINSRFRSNVKDTLHMTRFLDIAQQIALADRHVDVEISLKKKVQLGFEVDQINSPLGPRAPLQQVRLTSSPHVPSPVEKVFSDTDLKANDAIIYLSSHEISEHVLTKILSVGALGLKKNRKLVPTRWSITAIDDMLSNNILDKVKQFQCCSEYALFEGNYLGNHYFILLFPEIFSFELFELYSPGSAWNANTNIMKASTDHEFFEGRKTYAEHCVGGYYSARLAVAEKLKEIKRQASVLVIRIETPAYTTGLGVWVTREAARRALRNNPEVFKEKESMLKTVSEKLRSSFNIDAYQIFAQSKLLSTLKNQKKLTAFF